MVDDGLLSHDTQVGSCVFFLSGGVTVEATVIAYTNIEVCRQGFVEVRSVTVSHKGMHIVTLWSASFPRKIRLPYVLCLRLQYACMD